MRTPRSRDGGFTITELMIAMLLSTIALAAAISMGANMMRGFGDSRRLTVTQRNVRIAMENIASSLRTVSPGVSDGDIVDLGTCSTFGAYQLINGANAPDQLNLIHAVGGIYTEVREAFPATGDTTIRVLDPTGGTFANGDYILIISLTESRAHLMRLTAAPTPLGGGEQNLNVANPTTQAGTCGFAVNFPAGNYQPGDLVVRARIVRFYVAAFNTVPTLMMDADAVGAPEPLAEGVEDFQIAVGVDANADSILTEGNPPNNVDEWHYNAAGDAAPPALPGGVGVAPRAVRVTLVARAADEANRTADNIPPRPEDRTDAAPADTFRRRVLKSIVETRNFEGIPMNLLNAIRGRRAARERGGSLVVVLMITTALLGGAGVAIYVQLADTRSVGLVRESRSALFCAESGLAVARTTVANNFDQWGAMLDTDPVNDPVWYPIVGDMGDGGATDFSVTLVDNMDEIGVPNDTTVDRDGRVFVVARCTAFNQASSSVMELMDFSAAGGNNYRSQSGAGASHTGNTN